MKFFRYLFPILLLCLLGSCNGYEQLRKSTDLNLKLTKANEYFDKGDYIRANTLYEDLMPVLKGTKYFEQLYFRFAYSAYYMKNYEAASYHFKNFTDYFPSSVHSEEAEFMNAISLYKMSPKASLEQTNSIKAMEAMQSYINTHQESARIAEANTYMDLMRKKMETKDAAAAKLYFDIGQYKAAGIAYKSVLQTYPDSPHADLYQFMIIKAYYNYAKQSIEEKQEERFALAANAYADLREVYPKSLYLDDAQRLSGQITENIKKLRHEHE
jgi:outer membrane protein assembly factor BamD